MLCSKNFSALISHSLFRYSSTDTQAIVANLSASPTRSWKMYLVIVPDTSQTHFMNILTSESLLSQFPPPRAPSLLLYCLGSVFPKEILGEREISQELVQWLRSQLLIFTYIHYGLLAAGFLSTGRMASSGLPWFLSIISTGRAYHIKPKLSQ